MVSTSPVAKKNEKLPKTLLTAQALLLFVMLNYQFQSSSMSRRHFAFSPLHTFFLFLFFFCWTMTRFPFCGKRLRSLNNVEGSTGRLSVTRFSFIFWSNLHVCLHFSPAHLTESWLVRYGLKDTPPPAPCTSYVKFINHH